MKAACLQGKNFTITELPDPTPSEGQLLVAPIATGICGSDLHLREQMAEMYAAATEEERMAIPSIVPGHEFCSTIVGVGRNVDKRWVPGMRIAANPFVNGSAGPECVGLSPTFSGGLATLSIVDAVRAVQVPEALPGSLAALTEPMSVGLHAARLANRQAGPNIVIGCGPVGLAVIFALRVAGKGPIVAADFSAPRRAAAKALGADIVLDPGESSPYEHWDTLGFTPGTISPLLEEIFDRPQSVNIFECVGAPPLIDQVMTHAPLHSHIIVVGVCAHDSTFIPIKGINKELTIEFSFAYNMAEFQEAMNMIANHASLAATLVTSQQPLAQTESAFDALASNPTEIKIIIDPQA